MASQPKTAEEYLAKVPTDRRAELEIVRDGMRKNLDSGYEEGVSYGMISYCVPHRLYPAGYHCDPKQALPFAILGAKKNYLTLHLMCVYAGGTPESAGAKLQEWFRATWAKTGKKLDMGEACIRFKRADDLALDAIAQVIRKVPSAKWIETNKKLLEARQAGKKAKKKAAGA